MMDKKLTLLVVITAVVSSTVTFALDHLLLHVPKAMAQERQAPLKDYVFFAHHRKDTEKDESFFFYNPTTGDIYVYQEGSAKEHYRVRTVGEDLEKLK